ncbi:MAG: serine/threonine-protein kinase [Steroidobacteraceae bacterium]
MNKTAARTDETVSQVDLLWQRRVDALICGECSEADFMAELASLRQSGADSTWSVLALLDQRYRRGQLPIELFRSIEAKIARRELGALDYGTTVELDFVPAPAASKPQISRADPVDILTVDYPIEPLQAAEPVQAAAGAAAPPAPAERVLRNRYVLETRLGSGGMGTVFKAVDRYRCDLPQASRIVAIKFLHEAAGHPEIVSKLRREFYCAQALSHPNIVKVYELDRDGDVEFFTMEFLDGELLSSVVEKLQPMPLSRPRAWGIIRDVAAGLAHAHSRNVVHGDLKPQNIMITHSGDTRILDFGASSAEIAQKSTASAMTPAYASCELLEGQGADPRDDLYALACLSYELLAGRHPFQLRRSTAARDLGLIAQRPRGLTRAQWRTLKVGLAWRREDRSMTVADWIAALRPAAPAARRARPQSVIGVALAVVIAAAALAFFYHRPPLEHKTLDGAARSPAAADGPTAPGAATPDASAPTAPVSPGTTTGAAPFTAASATPAAAAVAPPAAPPPTARRGSAAPPAKTADSVGLAAGNYWIGAHRNFAEIRVRRSNGSGGEATFAWWTEPGSALPGTDYLAQGRTVQLLSAHSQMATLFVKLVPNVSRKHRAEFYVVIAEPGGGASLGRITRARVVLPPQ